MSLFDKLTKAQTEGKSIDFIPARSGGRIEVDKVWAGFSRMEAARAFPKGTKVAKVEGKDTYYCSQEIDGGVYKYAFIVENNNEVFSFCLYPAVVRQLENSHEFHTLSDGRLCIPTDSFQNAFGGAVAWSIFFQNYLRTGDSSPFRRWDNR